MKILLACTLALGILVAGCGGGGGGAPSPQDPLPAGQKGTWTVLVYLNAANDLYRFSPENVNQMEQVAGNPKVRFVLQWKQVQLLYPDSIFDGTRRYLVYPDNTDTLKSKVVQNMGNGVDMGAHQTLTDFVNWGKAQYPADHYLLVIWNHGNGWERSVQNADNGRAVSYDDETHTAIQIWELKQALQGLGLDTVAFDASLMQMAEVAYEIKDATPLVVGSEESPPGEGYPYQTVFRNYQDHPDWSAGDLSKGFVDGMVNNPAYATRKITQSVLKTNKLGAVGTATSNLATALIAHPELSTQIQDARRATQAYSITSTRHYYDLAQFCAQLRSRVTASDLIIALDATTQAGNDSILWEGHNSNSPGSRGLAIDLSTGSQFDVVAAQYSNLNWAQNTTWSDWLTVAP
ncbi:hypothetical protein BH11ARM1_BH11ARM1_16700 [soil metagenome]